MDYHQECRDTCINMNESLNIMSPPPKKKHEYFEVSQHAETAYSGCMRFGYTNDFRIVCKL